MSFRLITRPDRIGTEILSILFQFYYCYINNYYLKYNATQMKYIDSIFLRSILKIIDEYNTKCTNINNSLSIDEINIAGPGRTDMCYGMGKIVQLTGNDMLSFFKQKFYEDIKDFYNSNSNYHVPFDAENSIVIHLRLDDQWWEEDYDGNVCSNHYIELINNNEKCHFTNGPNNKYNKQNPISSHKIKKQLDILLDQFPESKVIIVASPLTKIPELNFKYDMLIQNEDYNHDLYLLSKSKKIILSRSNFALVSLLFGEQTHVHMPLWGHFACAGFGTKYDKCNFNYFY
jgi:hypothetical protein